MKTLIIVESPHKGELIKKFLSKDYEVLASKGHITDLAKGGRFGIGINIEQDFKPHYVLMEDKIETLNKLLAAAKKCDQILIASDPDREGEAIAWHLRQRLLDTEKPIKRITFKEITKKAVLESLKHVRDVDDKVFHSQEARRILDRIVGFSVSPFLMNYFGPKLSAGRVQSVVTRMIIDREVEIEKFVPEDFWNVNVSLSKDNKTSFIAKYDTKITTQKVADIITDTMKKATKFVVSEVISDEEKRNAPAPLITSTLQQIMSKNHAVPADRTMKAAQALYENGYCTYIRTDSTRTEEDALKEVREWLKDNKHVVPVKPNLFKNKDASQDAHECIRPSDLSLDPMNNVEIIDPDQKKVYEVIWKSFVASQMAPAIFDTLKITLYPDNDPKSKIRAGGKALKDPGYLKMIGTNAATAIDLPSLIKGEELLPFGKNPVGTEKKATQPSPRYTQHTLVKELDNRGIGRPATYAEILTKITTRDYVTQVGSVYKPTDLGRKINNELVKFFEFMDYGYTANMELQLDEIANKNKDHVKMLRDFYTPFKKSLDDAYVNHGAGICEKCTYPMVLRSAKNGSKFIGCSNYPKCKNTKNAPEVKTN
jgi:DNA topoisomerase-1